MQYRLWAEFGEKNMRKNILALVMTGTLALSMTACGNGKAEVPERIADIENEILRETETVEETAEEQAETEVACEDTFSFARLKQLNFYFASGVGGWATELAINGDGSFSGVYFDGEMGVCGEEFPNGTEYRCDFTGQFSTPVKVNDYTYSVRLDALTYEKTAGTEEIIDGKRYCYSDAYGLDGAEEILIYLPDAPLEELPEEYRGWVGYYDLSNAEESGLPYYGLYNVAEQCGFSSYDIVDALKTTIAYTEDIADSLEDSIRNDPLTQLEYNEKTKELYDLWDDGLNQVWNVLKRTRDAEAMSLLTKEEKMWIALKEQTVAEAGAAYEGSSIQSMIMNQKAAEMTRARVHELMEYF